MSMMTTVQIEREIVIDAPVDIVWRIVSEPTQISQWFADRVDLDARPGGHGTLVFDGDDGRPAVTAPLVVEAVEPPRRFAFRWSHPEGAEPEAGNSILVEFILSAEGNARTRLRVSETGLETVDWAQEDKERYAREHNEGWGHFLDRLASLGSSSG
jgi:uncharacterized protein YndB with AHSA1/START domain